MMLHYGSTSPPWISTEQPLMAKLNWSLRGEAVCEKENPLIHTQVMSSVWWILHRQGQLKVNVRVETPLRALCKCVCG